MFRSQFDEEKILELTKSINEQGLLVPIKVRPIDDGFELIYGHRRTEAMRRLGWIETEAIVEGMDELTSLLQQIIENEVREDLSYRERAEGYEIALQKANSNIAEFARRTGISPTRISNALHWLEEYRSGSAVMVDKEGGLGPKDAGVVRTLEIRRALGDDVETKKAVAIKVSKESLGRFQARELARKIASESDPMKREIILKEPFHKNSDNDRKPAPFSRSFHASDKSFSDQIHSKLFWNLQRIDLLRFDHFTISYSQRTLEQMQEILEFTRATLLVDARRNPISQYKPEFSKTNLRKFTQSMHIDYKHIPELGIATKDRIDLANTHDYEILFSNYDQQVNVELIKRILGESLYIDRIVFLCVELDPIICHRHRIALLLEKMGFHTYDL